MDVSDCMVLIFLFELSFLSLMVSTYLVCRSGCLSIFFSNEMILSIVITLLFGNVGASSFHNRPTEYVLFSLLAVVVGMTVTLW